MPNHSIITTFTLVKFLLSLVAFTEVSVAVYTHEKFTLVSKLRYRSKTLKCNEKFTLVSKLRYRSKTLKCKHGINEAHAINELTVSQQRGVITLIPKEDGSLLELGNWRPITLLNVDLKIAAKAIAKRLEPVLPKLIHPDQMDFVKGRYIGENIRLISDVLEYTKVQNIPGILLSLDFRKAFDSIEWPFIMKTLDHFNFGTGIKKWISTFYTNIESAVVTVICVSPHTCVSPVGIHKTLRAKYPGPRRRSNDLTQKKMAAGMEKEM